MQMANPPPTNAKGVDWAYVLDVLEKIHRIWHLDWDDLVVLKDDEGVVRPIVIDLEDYEILQP